MVRTVEAVQTELSEDGLLRRYRTDDEGEADGLAGHEGVFLACNFWLVDALALLGRHDEAVRLYERLLGLRNDVGLLSEEYEPSHGRLVGNFPQAFSHVGLVNSAFNLAAAQAPLRDDISGSSSGRRSQISFPAGRVLPNPA